MTEPTTNRRQRTVVAVGASAGGVRALCEFAEGLPRDLPLAVAVVLHMPAGAHSALASILDRIGPLRARPVVNGEAADAGTIYVGRPDHHLVLDDGRFFLTDGPTENGHRPAINATFRSLAVAAGARSIGVLLSGVLDDGILGLRAIRSRGGTTIVQEPSDAMYPGMPQNAMAAGVVDRVAPAREIGQLLGALAKQEVETMKRPPDALLEVENRIAMGSRFTYRVSPEELGLPSGYTCPDCSGPLIEVSKENFRCRVGHAWSPAALLNAQDSDIERALWVALRTLDEKGQLSATLAERAANPTGQLRSRYEAAAKEASHAAKVIRERLALLYEAQSGEDERHEQVG
jgi:two-component system chemotaxis response regulator CheB